MRMFIGDLKQKRRTAPPRREGRPRTKGRATVVEGCIETGAIKAREQWGELKEAGGGGYEVGRGLGLGASRACRALDPHSYPAQRVGVP